MIVNTTDKAVAIIMDPISDINPKKDTSLALLIAAQKQGCQLVYFEQDCLFLKQNQCFGKGQPLQVFDNQDQWYALQAQKDYNLKDFDLVFMRTDPPVDKRYIHTTYMLEKAGTKVVNNPAALRNFNEKLLALEFPEYIPQTLVASDYATLKDFLDKQNKIILKPLDAMAGSGIFTVESGDVNFDVIWEMHTQNGRYPIIAQKYIPEIREGDKRVLILNDQIYPHMMVRIPKSEGMRGNLAAGAGYEIREVGAVEQEIANATRPFLKEIGISFAGLDIIGDKLIEVNITSPTGMCQIAQHAPENPADIYIQGLLSGL